MRARLVQLEGPGAKQRYRTKDFESDDAFKIFGGTAAQKVIQLTRFEI